MGMPDAGYIEFEMLCDFFQTFPKAIGLAYRFGDHPNIEVRLTESFEQLPYAEGQNSQATEDMAGFLKDMTSTIKSFGMLRGCPESDSEEFNEVQIRNRAYVED